jgi:predicted AlkP superfamily pyrophosphatase or phosphodiesterase
MIRIARLLTVLFFTLVSTDVPAAGTATHVVVVVWDGLRPDFVTQELTPTLRKLAREGVALRNHHAAYPSLTEVNGAVLATGVYPEENGIIGNREFRPAINSAKRIKTEALEAVRKGDALTGNHYLGSPTVAETLHNRDRRTAIAGTKAVALLHDRMARADESLGVTLYEGQTLPEGILGKLTGRLGDFPLVDKANPKGDPWTTSALIGPLWDKEVPAFSLLWLSQPDYSQHVTGPGSPTSRQAIRSADEELARILAALEKRHLRDKTDILVVSDHGFSTIADNADIAALLNKHGFHAAHECPEAGPRNGDILVVRNGGSVFCYVAGHDQKLVEGVVHVLQAQPCCGVIFTRQSVEGAFTLQDARINSPAAPDIVLSLRWKPDKSANGTPGLVYSDYGKYATGQGMHGSLSPFDMHNTCVAAGPDFRNGFEDALPTGNTDIAPTILWILGVEPEQRPSGRVLREALKASSLPQPKIQHQHLEAARHSGSFTWRQYLNYSQINGVVYFDEGNGELIPDGAVGAN